METPAAITARARARRAQSDADNKAQLNISGRWLALALVAMLGGNWIANVVFPLARPAAAQQSQGAITRQELDTRLDALSDRFDKKLDENTNRLGKAIYDNQAVTIQTMKELLRDEHR
jgi:hypothetical protein